MRSLLLGVVLSGLCQPVAAGTEAVPRHLASLASQLYRSSAGELERADEEGEARDAAQRAMDALRRTGIRNWARGPVTLQGAAQDAADHLGLDLASEPDAAFLQQLLALPDADIRDALRARDGALPDHELNERVTALNTLRSPADLETEHTIQLPGGESVRIQWTPQTGTVVVRARSDGSDGKPAYDAALIGHSELLPDPETGDLHAALRAEETASARVYTQRDLERLQHSILGEWRTTDGTVYTIAAADESAGDIETQTPDAERLITEAEQRIKEIENSIIYIWTHPETGAIERQQRFRRLNEPWDYQGQQYADENTKAEIAALRKRIEELTHTSRPPPMRQHDPAGFEELSRSRTARPITITVRNPDGYSYNYDEAVFDGRNVRARRTYRDIRDLKQALPDWVKQELIAAWAPPGWLELEAGFNPATGAVELTGEGWGLHVTYSSGMFGDGSVESIHTPFTRPITLERSGMPGYRFVIGEISIMADTLEERLHDAHQAYNQARRSYVSAEKMLRERATPRLVAAMKAFWEKYDAAYAKAIPFEQRYTRLLMEAHAREEARISALQDRWEDAIAQHTQRIETIDQRLAILDETLPNPDDRAEARQRLMAERDELTLHVERLRTDLVKQTEEALIGASDALQEAHDDWQQALDAAEREIRIETGDLEFATREYDRTREELAAADSQLADAQLALAVLYAATTYRIVEITSADFIAVFDPDIADKLRDLNDLIRNMEALARTARRDSETSRRDMITAGHDVEIAGNRLARAGYYSKLLQAGVEGVKEVHSLAQDARKGGPWAVIISATSSAVWNLWDPPTYYDAEPSEFQAGLRKSVDAQLEGFSPSGKLDNKLMNIAYDYLPATGKLALEINKSEQAFSELWEKGFRLIGSSAPGDREQLNRITEEVAKRANNLEKTRKSLDNRLLRNSIGESLRGLGAEIMKGQITGLVKGITADSLKRSLMEAIEGQRMLDYLVAEAELAHAVRIFRIAGNMNYEAEQALLLARAARAELVDKLDANQQAIIERNDEFTVVEGYRFTLYVQDTETDELITADLNVTLESVPLTPIATPPGYGRVFIVPEDSVHLFDDTMPEQLTLTIQWR